MIYEARDGNKAERDGNSLMKTCMRTCKTKKWLFILLITGIVSLISLELFARFYLGLGQQPLYIENKGFNYIYAPNQHVKRFGNRMITNEFSMRSKPLSASDEIRILLIGDSVINGGSLTDHDKLASTILEERLSQHFNKKVRVLNISAGGWGPDNAAGYIKEHGDFSAPIIVLVFSSHDAYSNTSLNKIVGKDVSFPDEQPFCAISDGFTRYLIPRLLGKVKSDKKEYLTTPGQFNPGWDYFVDYANKNNKKLFVVVHPTITEIEAGNYKPDGQLIINYLVGSNIKYLTELKNPPSISYYRDDIHYNEHGQRFLANELCDILIELVRTTTL